MTGVAKQTEQATEIEFRFEFGSNYGYVGVMRIEEEARRRGVSVVWKPLLLGPIFRALGMENSPFVLQKEKGSYVQQSMARLCRKYDLAPMRRAGFVVCARGAIAPSALGRLAVCQVRSTGGELARPNFPSTHQRSGC